MSQSISTRSHFAVALFSRYPLMNYSHLLTALILLSFLLASCKSDNVSAKYLADTDRVAESVQCKSITYKPPAEAGSSIKFFFNETYSCGQFANGDWWVSEGRRGYVQIDRIAPDALNGLHGYEINPSNSDRQAFDKRISGYDTTLSLVFPLQVEGDSSVVKAVSSEIAKEGQPACRPCLDYAVVLTVTKEPVQNAKEVLRPSYFGEDKQFYRLKSVVELQMKQLYAICCDEAKSVTFEALARRYHALQLDHLTGWGGRKMHPRANMPDYGASIARDNAISVLRLLLNDFNPTKEEHKAALVGYLQMGVDLKAMALGGVNWPASGGHGNGRKLPLLFAGWLLDEASFDLALKTASFSEDEQIYWSETAQRSLFGRNCGDAAYWSRMRTGSGPKDCRDPYGYIDGYGYQFCCTSMPWKYTALAVTILGLEKQFNSDALLDYAHRWVNHGVWAEPDPCAPYNGNPDDYARQYGPGANGACISGGGRHLYSAKGSPHGENRDAGNYSSEFGDELWLWYWQGQKY